MSTNESKSAKPKITPSHDGPYLVEGATELVGSDGTILDIHRGCALCACGESKKKPLCDGSYTDAGFRSENKSRGEASRRKDYTGDTLTVHFDASICAHVGNCLRGAPEVFDLKKRPWVSVDNGDAEKIIRVINSCPSGALSYSVDGVEHRDREASPSIRVGKNGPLEINGSIDLEAAEFSELSSREHYTLCRCGQSKNKPFCDGSHHAARFRD
jgi:CDGSH-type Zn-finger protein